MTTYAFTVYGIPKPQGSKRWVGKRAIEDNPGTADWRIDVTKAALDYLGVGTGIVMPALDGPICVALDFTLPKPASAPKTKRTFPARKPDIDKLTRAIFDSLTAAGLWADDGRVVLLVAAKFYPGEGPGALDRPGVHITAETANP